MQRAMHALKKCIGCLWLYLKSSFLLWYSLVLMVVFFAIVIPFQINQLNFYNEHRLIQLTIFCLVLFALFSKTSLQSISFICATYYKTSILVGLCFISGLVLALDTDYANFSLLMLAMSYALIMLALFFVVLVINYGDRSILPLIVVCGLSFWLLAILIIINGYGIIQEPNELFISLYNHKPVILVPRLHFLDQYVSLILPLIGCFFIHQQGKNKIKKVKQIRQVLGLATTSIGWYFLIITGSKAALVEWIAISIIGLLCFRSIFFQYLRGMLLGLMFAVLSYLCCCLVKHHSLIKISIYSGQYRHYAEQLNSYVSAFKRFLLHPVLAVVALMHSMLSYLSWHAFIAEPYNIWLMIFYEWGIVISVIIVGLSLRLIYHCVQIIKVQYNNPLVMVIVFSLVVGFIQSLLSFDVVMVPVSQIMLAIIVGVVVGLIIRVRHAEAIFNAQQDAANDTIPISGYIFYILSVVCMVVVIGYVIAYFYDNLDVINGLNFSGDLESKSYTALMLTWVS
ncbi:MULTISPECIES: hypothetical protein [Cysteiniphilum]|uniref:hypothetical protein n=1 Tax=Cysteiniphilum TaxID=2056696 RepID=UPI0017822065|nr:MULTISPECIES: hypothetical protein [Cysteiniphilum]